MSNEFVLSTEQTAAAVEELVCKYPPRVVNTDRDERIPGQATVLVSTNLFSEPQKTSRGHNIYGFIKIRGVVSSDFQENPDPAITAATKIIKYQDSKFPIKFAPVGCWVPITTDPSDCREKIDVRMNDEELHLRDQAVREKNEKDKQVKRELREREEELKKDSDDIYSNTESLDYYTMRRVTELTLYNKVLEIRNNLESMTDVLNKARKECAALEQKFPEYSNEWLDRYNEKRAETGIGKYIPNSYNVQEYEDWKAANSY